MGLDIVGSVKKMTFSLGLRGKLLIATLTVLMLPVASYYYLIELETFLKDNQLKAQLESSRLLAGFFDNSEQLIHANALNNGQQSIYAYPLSSRPIIDGYFDDWKNMYLKEQLFFSHEDKTNHMEKFSLLTGIKGKKLYLFLSVNDSSPRYRLPDYQNHYDRVKLSLADETTGKVIEFFLETEAPGWFKAITQNAANTFSAYEIKGEWQEKAEGYQLEFSIPLTLIDNSLAVTVYDNGVPTSTLDIQEKYVGSNGSGSGSGSGNGSSKGWPTLNPLVRESLVLNQRLKQQQKKLSDSQARLYIINQQHEVLASAGEFKTSELMYREPDSIITHLTNLYRVLMGLNIENRRYFGQLSHLNGKEIDLSLGQKNLPGEDKIPGRSGAAWLAGSNSQTLILSTASPIRDEQDNILGALVLEKTNATILALQDKTVEKLLLVSLVLFFSTGILLLLYSGRLVSRILQLQRAAEEALTQDGKLKPVFPSSHSQDEIGQLSRSFATLMQRLNQYTGYLESLAGKLSHELRTPLSIIKSSLENMQFQEVEEKNQVFLQRALDGSERLSLILTRMGEASRLEQALQSSEKQKIEINQFMQNYVEAIKLANADTEFSLILPPESVYCFIAPELIAQLLDKLIANAISFNIPGTFIEIAIIRDEQRQCVQMDIFNQGTWIVKEQQNSIFDSMVSHRFSSRELAQKELKKPNQLNLGLGLHIARLISEYHQAKLAFYNRKTKNKAWHANGVSFVLSLPIMK